MKLNKGDVVWIDTAPLVASPTPTGKSARCEVVHGCSENDPQVYVHTEGGSMLYVFKKWIRKSQLADRGDGSFVATAPKLD
jgi:hypothetical protein